MIDKVGKKSGRSSISPNEATKAPADQEPSGVKGGEEVDLEFLNDFLSETGEHLETIEADIINLENEPGNIDLIHELFREFHTIKGLAGFVDQNLIRELAHRTETLLDKSRKKNIPVDKGLIDLILQSSDYIKRICTDLGLNQDRQFLALVARHLGVLEQQDSLEQPGDGETIAARQAPTGEDQAPDGRRAPDHHAKGAANIEGGHVRVPNQKVDSLGDLAGELMIIQSQIEQEIIKRLGANDALVASLTRMEKIGKSIQGLSMSLRMISLKSTFLKLHRIGRDAAVETGKNVRLHFRGEETEIDRRVAESILDPLLHLVKNSICHGIEPEDVRISRGKPAQGSVTVQAYSRRGNVFIDVSDDGQGISLERIREKAGEKQLLDPARTYEDEEILDLIFLPGFTTLQSANSISGRGVGLDVVRTEVSRIGGRVEVKNRPGEGCSFLLKIPINLAAINGTIVDVAGGSYIIPTLYIRQIVNLAPEQWVSIAGNKSLVRIKEEIIPVVPVARLFGLEENEDAVRNSLVVVVELEHKLIALPVQGVIDRREMVIKTLGSDFSDLAYVAGASILGDGRVSLILDVESLFGIGEVM